MRRQHKTGNVTPGPTPSEWINTITAMGCVFYAPMDQTNGFVDLISGITGAIPSGNNNCTVTWDSTLNAYVIDNKKTNYIGFWWDGLNMFPNMDTSKYWVQQSCSWIVTYRWVTAPDYNYYNVTHGFGGADGGLSNSVGGASSSRQVSEYCSPYGHNLPYSTGQWVMCTGTNSWSGSGTNRTIRYYKDRGVQCNSVTNSFALEYQTRFGSRFFLAAIFPNNGARTHLAVKNAYVFNKALSVSEIQQIYDHDYQ